MLMTATDDTSYKSIRRQGPDGNNGVEPWILFYWRLKNNELLCPLFQIICTHNLASYSMFLTDVFLWGRSSVGIATDYGLDGLRSYPGGDEIFRRPAQLWGPSSLLYNGYRVFPGGKVRPGRAADHSLLLVLRSCKSRAIPLLPFLMKSSRCVLII